MAAIVFEGSDNDLASKVDALRCDHVKSALYGERQRIASGIMRIVRNNPELKGSDEELSELCLDAMFYFGEDVFEALNLIRQHGGPYTPGDRVMHLQKVLLSYFDLRTLK